MKYVNFYSGTALALIASLLGSLGAATGQMAPPLIVGALLFTVLVLGWAGGASDSRHELERLTRLEAGRQLQMTCNAAARDRLEATNEALRAQVKDCQAAIEVFTAAQAGTMVRITALEGENDELRAQLSGSWADGGTSPEQDGWYERKFTDGIYSHWWNGRHWAMTEGGAPHYRQVNSYVSWRPAKQPERE